MLLWTACLLIPSGCLTFGLAATCRPSWYRPAAVDHSRLWADKAALVKLQDDISAALNAGRSIRLELDAAQVNRWLAARAEMWPDAALDLGPLSDPQVCFAHAGIRLGATARRGGFGSVVSLECSIDVTDDSVVIYCESARLGAVPIPLAWLTDRLAEPFSSGPLIVREDLPGAAAIANDWIWPNGKRRCRLGELSIDDGKASVLLEPLERKR